MPDTSEIRPSRVDIPEAALVDLRQRIAATRWPDRETVADRSQGAQLNKIPERVRYWGTDYDWRKAEAKLNALPQFVPNLRAGFTDTVADQPTSWTEATTLRPDRSRTSSRPRPMLRSGRRAKEAS